MRILTAMLVGILAAGASARAAEEVRQATGIKVGEVTADSAIVWVRLTAAPKRVSADEAKVNAPFPTALPDGIDVNDLEGACPGAPGRVRVMYGPAGLLGQLTSTAWVDVGPETDFSHQFRLTDLRPGTTYEIAAQTVGPNGQPQHGYRQGIFQTAPKPDTYGDVTFTVVTGMMYRDLDHPAGFHIYDAMSKLEPQFIVPTGDTVYYDNEAPVAVTPALARYHWHRMYSLPRLVAFHLKVPGYWEKDDHDTVHNDCWPSGEWRSMRPMTFKKGQQIFREQVPMGERTYRTRRWGKALQIWMVEGRDFRSPNDMKDGPDKTIWGAEQKRWLTETLLASDADWKVLISPTPIVGPDRKRKADNHANAAFEHEGDWFRNWVKQHVADNFFVACGDRHWQYHSIHPETGMHEFSCGPASDEHSGGTPGEDPDYHQFHRVRGGFLSVNAKKAGDQSVITFRHHDVHGKVVYTFERKRPAR